MKPTLRLSIHDLFMLEEALAALRLSELSDKRLREETLKLQVAINDERMVLESHRCTEYHHDCPTCNRDRWELS